jgi:hypothetical protein
MMRMGGGIPHSLCYAGILSGREYPASLSFQDVLWLVDERDNP